MPGKTGFDFSGASQGFNVLAEYLFGKVYETPTFGIPFIAFLGT